MNPSEIIPNLFIGNINDSLVFDGDVITVVHHNEKYTLAKNATWLPVLEYHPSAVPGAIDEEYANRKNCDAVAEAIDTLLQAGRKVLVHCLVGMERSPFAVAYFLQKKRGMGYNEAYDLIISKRPFVQRRAYRFYEAKDGIME